MNQPKIMYLRQLIEGKGANPLKLLSRFRDEAKIEWFSVERTIELLQDIVNRIPIGSIVTVNDEVVDGAKRLHAFKSALKKEEHHNYYIHLDTWKIHYFPDNPDPTIFFPFYSIIDPLEQRKFEITKGDTYEDKCICNSLFTLFQAVFNYKIPVCDEILVNNHEDNVKSKTLYIYDQLNKVRDLRSKASEAA